MGVGAAYALKVALLSEEPPIRVRPGSIELHLTGGKKWQAKTGYWQIKDGKKTATQYNLVITTMVSVTNCKLQSNPRAFKVTDSERNSFSIAIVNKRTRVTASGSVTLSPDKRVLTIRTGGYIDEFWDETDPKNPTSICKLGKDEFADAGVY